MQKKIKSVSVVLPTFNERGNIGPLLEAIVRVFGNAQISDYQVIVVDDDSRDGTRELVQARQEQNPRIELHVRKNARGLATAVRYGLERTRCDIVLMMDSDYNHDPSDLPQFLEKIEEGYEVVVGSRYVKGGFMESSVLRHYLSMIFNIFVQAMLGLKTKDNLSGYIAMQRAILQRIDMDRVFIGFGEFHIPLIFQIQKMGLRVCEVPVVYGERQYGKSKFHPVRNLINYTKIIFKIRAEWGHCR